MSTRLFSLFFLLVVLVSTAECEKRHRICGARLVQTVMTVCKSLSCQHYKPLKHITDSDVGIASRCCSNTCSIREIQSYCCDDHRPKMEKLSTDEFPRKVHHHAWHRYDIAY